jgi:hypothetical protein
MKRFCGDTIWGNWIAEEMPLFKTFHRVLFNLTFELAGFRADVAQYIQVWPDKRTNDLFPHYHLSLRKQKNSFLTLIEVDEAEDSRTPIVPIKENEVFRFQVKVTDIVFFSRTHLYSYDFRSNTLMLSNDNDHVDGMNALLTKPVPHYSSAGEYKSGYIVSRDKNYYKAIKSSSAADPHDVSDPTYWKNISDGSFVSQEDLVPRPAGVDLNTIMVVDIKNSMSIPVSHQLLDVTSQCREITYRVKLLNRQ